MSHLGQRISALIDGELSDSERDRVLAHIAGCDECRQEAVALRALKQRMHTLGEAMVDAALTGRLMAMAMPPDGRPWSARPPWRPRGSFPAARILTAGLLASTVAGVGAAAFFAGGEQQVPGPRVTPAVGTFLVQHAIVAGDVPVTPPGGSASRPGGAVSAPAAAGQRPGQRPGQQRDRRDGRGGSGLRAPRWPKVRQPSSGQDPPGGRPVSRRPFHWPPGRRDGAPWPAAGFRDYEPSARPHRDGDRCCDREPGAVS